MVRPQKGGRPRAPLLLRLPHLLFQATLLQLLLLQGAPHASCQPTAASDASQSAVGSLSWNLGGNVTWSERGGASGEGDPSTPPPAALAPVSVASNSSTSLSGSSNSSGELNASSANSSSTTPLSPPAPAPSSPGLPSLPSLPSLLPGCIGLNCTASQNASASAQGASSSSSSSSSSSMPNDSKQRGGGVAQNCEQGDWGCQQHEKEAHGVSVDITVCEGGGGC